MMKQILLITDGCSNVGIQPTIAATEARENEIIVNVVGIVDYGTIGQFGACEIEEIARVGGGISQIVQSHELSHTFQMMTQYSERVCMMDGMAEQSPLRIALLIDASASMRPKLAAVEEAIRDFMLSLQARNGQSELSIFHFPGPFLGDDAVQDMTWTDDVRRIKKWFKRLNMRGATPTGPALLQVVDYFRQEHHSVCKEAEIVPALV